ncbi:LOW QUALITY PROTEIN: mas-related G-protein coupled receptor member X2-like [Thomomys bottae]
MATTTPAWGLEITTRNTSDQDFLPPGDEETMLLRLLSLIIALAGLAGNTIVLWLLGFHIHSSPFSTYILNLAGADFFFLCCHILGSLMTLIRYFGSVAISVPNFLTTVMLFHYITGLSILSSISTERYLCLLCPIWYRYNRPKYTSAVICSLLWALSLLLSTLEGIQCGFLFRADSSTWCQMSDFICAAWLMLLCVILSESSLALLVSVFCSSRRNALTRLYVTILLTVLVFLLCGIPLGFYWFLAFWIPNSILSWRHFQVGIVLSCVNSSANPIIYFLVGSFRQQLKKQTLKLLLQRALQHTPEVECGDSFPQEALPMSRSSMESQMMTFP